MSTSFGYHAKEIDKHPNIIADRLAVLKVFLQASDGVLLFFTLFLILSLFCF